MASMDFVEAGNGKSMRALTYALPLYPVSDSLLHRVDAEVVAWDTVRAPIMTSAKEPEPELDYASVKDYLRALLAIRLKDNERLLEFKSRLASKADLPFEGDPTSRRDYSYYFLRSIEGMEALDAGNYEEVLAAVEDSRLFIPFFRNTFVARTLNRFMMAEALAGLGRLEEAVDAYRSMADRRYYGLVYLGPSYIRLAEVHERLGNTDRAIEYYERLIRLWKECDPELVPMREAAREEANRLRSDSR
jgi:tetratricopeptide (TPR) repeat protein